MNWLSQALSRCQLTDEVEGYLLRRGAREESYTRLGVVTWKPLEEPSGNEVFTQRYGALGERLEGYLICPVYSPRGRILGFEARSTEKKAISEFLLPEAAWQPIWLGLEPQAMQRIWEGAAVWIGEGLFDLFAVEWIVPDGDVVLGSLRAKLTWKHVEFLRRFCPARTYIHMVYDRDEAGLKGMRGFVDETGRQRWGALKALEKAGLKGREVCYSGGKDPGEIWDRGGAPALRAAFSV